MKRKPGRPRKEISLAEMEKLLRMHCTLLEVAAWFNCSVDIIERRVLEATGKRFAEFSGEKRNAGKASLRRVQFNKALKGDRTMMVWLGKQYLDQSDKSEVKQHGTLEIYAMKDDERRARIEELTRRRIEAAPEALVTNVSDSD